jgi:ubiquinone/menaquinone biosynthesis C-methylase UbiE
MKIKEYWDEQALKHKNSQLATMPDLFSAQLEIKETLKYLSDGDKVLDIGCGNGFKDIEYCKQKNIILKGIDYSEEMINIAKEHETEQLKFDVGDMLNLKESIKYDVIITDRCLINLETIEDQIKAIDNIYNALKQSGTYLMMECTKEGLKNINEIREQFNLPLIEERWHNNYLGKEVLKYAFCKFDTCGISNFNSTYFLISRTINAMMGCQYDSDINKYAAQLPPFGDYAPLKLFILRK